ncbi:MAG TPA: hypothetical protein VF271_10075 [Rhodanobacteraceae bacterium]
MTSKPHIRPVPDSIVVTAFPDSRQGGPSPDPFFVINADSEQIRLPKQPAPWLTLAEPQTLAPQLSRVDYHAQDNTLAERRVDVRIEVADEAFALTFRQQPGELVQTELVRTLNCPLNIDCLVAVSFIAGLIKKIPIPPIKLIVLLLAVLALVVLAIVIAAVRRLIPVPEPQPLSTNTNGVGITIFPGLTIPNPVPSEGPLPLDWMAAENQTIALQTTRAIYWLVKQVM